MRCGLFLFSICLCVLLGAGTAPAKADVARRCGPDGCSYIQCNDTGDRCSRKDDRYGVENGYGDEESGEAPGRVCDPDGDRCYSSSDSRWDYREYYRRQGYQWRGDSEGEDERSYSGAGYQDENSGQGGYDRRYPDGNTYDRSGGYGVYRGAPQQGGYQDNRGYPDGGEYPDDGN